MILKEWKEEVNQKQIKVEFDAEQIHIQHRENIEIINSTEEKFKLPEWLGDE